MTKTTTTTSKPAPTTRRRVLATFVIATITFLAALAPTSPASAWTGEGFGARGAVTPSTIYVGDLLMPTGYRQFTLYGDVGPSASRVAGTTGQQTITAQYFAQKWNGSAWVTVAYSPVLSGTMAANQSRVNFAPPYLQTASARGFFRVTYRFDWYNSAGSSIGTNFIISNATSDHVCVTPYRLCQSSPGYVQTGLNLYSW